MAEMSAAFWQLMSALGLILLGLLIWAAFSPFETLGWWAGWFGDKIYDDSIPPDGRVRAVPSDAHAYIIFLSGIGRVSGQTLSYRETDFLRRLAQVMPHAVVIDDVFPYSTNNLALTGQPFFGGLWRWALRRKLDGPALAGMIINVRNAFQVWVSVDHRYGPIYNQATAEVILHALLRYDYPMERDDVPVFVIGYSGAGQMAVGAMTYLREWLPGPLYTISLGGIFGSDPGLLATDHLFHFQGANDHALWLRHLGPGRWPIFPTSEYNRAKRQGRISYITPGPMGHTGRGGYLDAKTSLPDGTPLIDRTVELVANIVNGTLEPSASPEEIAQRTMALAAGAEA